MQRFDYKPLLPLDIEILFGENWLNNEELMFDQGV